MNQITPPWQIVPWMIHHLMCHGVNIDLRLSNMYYAYIYVYNMTTIILLYLINDDILMYIWFYICT